MAYHPEIPQTLASTTLPKPSGGPEDAALAMLRYSSDALMPDRHDARLHLFPFRQSPAFGFAPIRIPDRNSPGLTLIGNIRFSFGLEWVFAAGNSVEERYPGDDKFIVIHFAQAKDAPQPALIVSPVVYGLGADDNLEFMFELAVPGSAVIRTGWQKSPAAQLAAPGLGRADGTLTIRVRNNNAGGTIVVRTATVDAAGP
jgi:hypothetical protein